MAYLIKIGNSQGVRIPRPLIEQAHLEGKELQLRVVDEGLLITPCKQPRDGWRIAIETVLAQHGAEPLDREWIDARLTSENEWEW
jgi:antitoxin MazE